ncbi:hypothetical protein A7L55_18750 [Acinetobacter baumannii]|nr:hypothetical protein A7L55_18750 [Acinetobacter baumannii]
MVVGDCVRALPWTYWLKADEVVLWFLTVVALSVAPSPYAFARPFLESCVARAHLVLQSSELSFRDDGLLGALDHTRFLNDPVVAVVTTDSKP